MDLIENNLYHLYRLCAAHNVDTMYLFGSARNGNFTAASDIDFLVRFKPIDLAHYFDNYVKFKESLTLLLGREVDVLEEQTLKNPILINSINQNKELIYG
jgi:predicted nucleotidyltransferase